MNIRAAAFVAVAGVVGVTPAALAQNSAQQVERADAFAARFQSAAMAQYPVQARRLGHSGTCDIVVFLDASGEPIEGHVESCSTGRFERAANNTLAELSLDADSAQSRATPDMPLTAKRMTISWRAVSE